MTDWNFADVWDRIAASAPERTAVAQGRQRTSWAAFEDRSARIAGGLRQAVLKHGAGALTQRKVAIYLYNRVEYLETMYGAFKARLVPINTNFRFGPDELEYLWRDSDSEIVIFDSALAQTADIVRRRLPQVHTWVCVGEEERPGWAHRYSEWIDQSEPLQTEPRSGDDVFMLYTGGTTGMPKGVEWRQDDMFCNLNAAALNRYPEDLPNSAIAAHLPAPSAHLAACPLMHGAGSITSMSALSQGGTVVLLAGRSFSAAEFLDAIAREKVSTVAITGDAVARPVADALDAAPRRWDVSTLIYIVSSAVTWSAEVKRRLHHHLPGVRLVDTLGSSEGMGVGRAVSRGSERRSIKGNFIPGRHTRVLSPEGEPVQAGSGRSGMLVVGGRQPLRYYKDPERSREVWRVIRGRRYALTGDYAVVEDDGSITLLGRGSATINSGGEKIYPAEVEAVMGSHPSVRDSAVVGIPDDRFGEAVVALVQIGDEPLTAAELIAYVKDHVAGYKAPRSVVFVEEISRLANGKLDYPALRARARGEVIDRETGTPAVGDASL